MGQNVEHKAIIEQFQNKRRDHGTKSADCESQKPDAKKGETKAWKR